MTPFKHDATADELSSLLGVDVSRPRMERNGYVALSPPQGYFRDDAGLVLSFLDDSVPGFKGTGRATVHPPLDETLASILDFLAMSHVCTPRVERLGHRLADPP